MKLPPPNAPHELRLLDRQQPLRRVVIPQSTAHAHNFLTNAQEVGHCVWDRAEVSLSSGYRVSFRPLFPLRKGDIIFVEKNIFEKISMTKDQIPKILKVDVVCFEEKGSIISPTIVTVVMCQAFPQCLGKLGAEEAQWWSDVLDSIEGCFEGTLVLTRHHDNRATDAFLRAQEGLET